MYTADRSPVNFPRDSLLNALFNLGRFGRLLSLYNDYSVLYFFFTFKTIFQCFFSDEPNLIQKSKKKKNRISNFLPGISFFSGLFSPFRVVFYILPFNFCQCHLWQHGGGPIRVGWQNTLPKFGGPKDRENELPRGIQGSYISTCLYYVHVC